MRITRLATLLIATILVSLSVRADDSWYPSKYGADDTLGAINNLSPEKVLAAVKLVKTGKSYPLGVETGPDSPAYPPRSYAMTILQLDDGTGTPLGSNKATGNDDLMNLWMGIGSQIDGLGHMGINHTYYNGNHASEFVTPKGLTKLSIDRLPPIVSRGVLLDMTRVLRRDPLPAAGDRWIAHNYIRLKDFEKAKKYLDSGFLKSQEWKDEKELRDFIGLSSIYFYRNKEYSRALDSLDKFINLDEKDKFFKNKLN